MANSHNFTDDRLRSQFMRRPWTADDLHVYTASHLIAKAYGVAGRS